MGNFNARDFVLSVQNVASPSTYDIVGALIDCTHTQSDPADDVTSKGDAGAQNLYIDGAIEAHSFSGNVVVTDETAYQTLLAAKRTGTKKINAQITDGIDVMTAVFVIETLTHTGGNQGALRGSIELRSTGPVSIVAVP